MAVETLEGRGQRFRWPLFRCLVVSLRRYFIL
jgi:hypothetical protein